MSKHTPGPWKVKDCEVFSKNGEGICVPYSIGKDDEANARLIAAAPDLLKALDRAYLQIIEFLNEGDFKRCVEWNAGYIVDALAKARGEK